MNSTDEGMDGGVAAGLAALFDDVLLPMALAMQSQGRTPFPMAPDVRWLSYYVRRRRSAMLASDFTGAACADGEEFGRQLAAHWRALGRAELAGHAERFAQIAGAAHQDLLARRTASSDAELNPYVYAMF